MAAAQGRRVTKWNLEPLSDDNYASWAVMAEAALVVDGLWAAVADVDVDNPQIDRLCKATIALLAGPGHANSIGESETARQLWAILREKYNPQCVARQNSVRASIISIRKGPGR